MLVAGAATRGSRRWIDIGFFRFQPSEFGKVLLALFLAAFLADRAKRLDEFRDAAGAIALAAVPIVLVFIQPDIGTALVYTAVLAAVLFVSGVRWLHLAVIGAVALIGVLAVLWWLPAAGRQRAEAVPGGAPHRLHASRLRPARRDLQPDQSITAVGAGGVRGRGVAGATQTRLDYLPEHATDFAFASLAEQRGFFGAVDAAAALPARRLARAEDRRGRARPVQRDRRRRARRSRSCSRCSSTSA